LRDLPCEDLVTIDQVNEDDMKDNLSTVSINIDVLYPENRQCICQLFTDPGDNIRCYGQNEVHQQFFDMGFSFGSIL
jgi:hypothetical protein